MQIVTLTQEAHRSPGPHVSGFSSPHLIQLAPQTLVTRYPCSRHHLWHHALKFLHRAQGWEVRLKCRIPTLLGVPHRNFKELPPSSPTPALSGTMKTLRPRHVDALAYMSKISLHPPPITIAWKMELRIPGS